MFISADDSAATTARPRSACRRDRPASESGLTRVDAGTKDRHRKRSVGERMRLPLQSVDGAFELIEVAEGLRNHRRTRLAERPINDHVVGVAEDDHLQPRRAGTRPQLVQKVERRHVAELPLQQDELDRDSAATTTARHGCAAWNGGQTPARSTNDRTGLSLPPSHRSSLAREVRLERLAADGHIVERRSSPVETIQSPCISLPREGTLCRWRRGNSLAIRLPAAVVDALDLKEATTSKSALRARASSK
jgi:hypothetical protein